MTKKKSILILGDAMKKILAIIILAIISGVLFSLFIFSKYEESEVSKEINKIYYIQQGVYSNYSNMLKNTEKLESYTYEKMDKKYYVYVCFTANKDNIPLIEKYFKNLNYSVTIKEKEADNINFFNLLSEYDYLMSAITKTESIKNICKQLVNKYEETK